MNSLKNNSNYQISSIDYSDIKFNIENLMFIIQNRYKLEHDKIDDIKHVFLDLDHLVSECNFNTKQMFVLSKIMEGYDNKYIAEKLDWYAEFPSENSLINANPDEKKVNDVLRNICNKLFLCHKYDYQDWLEINGIVKIPDNVKYYQCSICGKWRRKEAFKMVNTGNQLGKDGNICRICG